MFRFFVFPSLAKTLERIVKNPKKKALPQKRTKEAKETEPSDTKQKSFLPSSPAPTQQHKGLVLGPTFAKMREASLKGTSETLQKKKKIVDEETGPFVKLFWTAQNGQRRSLLSFNESKLHRYFVYGANGLGPKYELGVPFHEHLYGPVEKAIQDPIITMITPAENSNTPQHLSSTLKKRVLKMKKHKFKKRRKEARKQRRENK